MFLGLAWPLLADRALPVVAKVASDGCRRWDRDLGTFLRAWWPLPSSASTGSQQQPERQPSKRQDRWATYSDASSGASCTQVDHPTNLWMDLLPSASTEMTKCDAGPFGEAMQSGCGRAPAGLWVGRDVESCSPTPTARRPEARLLAPRWPPRSLCAGSPPQ